MKSFLLYTCSPPWGGVDLFDATRMLTLFPFRHVIMRPDIFGFARGIFLLYWHDLVLIAYLS